MLIAPLHMVFKDITIPFAVQNCAFRLFACPVFSCVARFSEPRVRLGFPFVRAGNVGLGRDLGPYQHKNVYKNLIKLKNLT